MKKNEEFSRKPAHFLKSACLALCLVSYGGSAIYAESTYAEQTTLTIRMNNRTVKDVFSYIEKNSEFIFVYHGSNINLNRKVNVDVHNQTVEAILNNLFKGTDIEYIINDRQIIVRKNETNKKQVTVTSPQQEKKITVKGNVKDENDEPLIGVNVIVKGTTIGSVTDVNGDFSLSDVDPNATIAISYTGYQTQNILLKGKNSIKVTLLENNELLDEVVVVGYATVKKANLTGAVDQVKGDILENRPITSVGQALQGKIANLSISSSTSANENGGGAPGAKMNINIRGISGLDKKGNAVSASPLVVIDGIQGGDLNTINPDDIESISVLKDAASAAIYGSNAPFGVILVTTKKGKLNAKPTITYSNNLSWSSPINLPKMANSMEWAKISYEGYENAGKYNYLNEDNAMQRIEDYFYGRITDETSPDYSSGRGYLWPGNANNDWFKIYFKDRSFSHQHNLSVSGGSQSSTYYVGLGYNEKNGMYEFIDDKYQRYSVRTNLSSILKPWLTTNVRTSFVRGATKSPSLFKSRMGDSGFMHNIARKWPTDPLKWPTGEYSEGSEVATMTDGGNTQVTDDLVNVTGELVVKPLPGWEAVANYTFSGNYIGTDINRFTTYYTEGVTGKKVPMNGTNPDYIERKNDRNEHHTINAYTSYEWEKSGHYLKGMVGFAQEIWRDRSAWGSANDLFTNEVPSLSTTYGQRSNGESRSTLSSRGVFSRINYGYKEKYLLELNGRYDGTSRFLEDVRFAFYPGVSAAWVVSKENFWKPIEKYVDLFKLRMSYGSLGDQTTIDSRYPFYPSLNTTSAEKSNWIFSDGRSSNISYPGIVNPSLTWVTSTTIDFGFDLSALNNRFTTTFDWFNRQSKDAIGPAEQLPAVLGESAPNTNNTELETKGFELTVSWRDYIGDFSYGIRGTLSDSRTQIKKYPNKNMLVDNWYNGKYIGEIWGYVTDRYFTEEDFNADGTLKEGIPSQTYFYGSWNPGDIKYKDLNNDGVIEPGDNTLDKPGDRKIIGNSSPRYTYGLTLDAAWKGIDCSIFFQGIGKRDYMSDNNSSDVYFWGVTGDPWQYAVFDVHLDRWTPETPNGYFPRTYLGDGGGVQMFQKNSQKQTKYLQNASYLRLKNLQIGYTIPKELLNKFGIDRLRVYVSGENLLTCTKLIKTIDPEFAGTNGKIYPLQRTWSVGLNVSF